MNSEPARLLTKRTLVTVSHAIEQAALAGAEDGPMLVVALFQRLPYFARERQVYERIATRAAVTVVAMVGDDALPSVAGCELVALSETEPYARDWSVVVLTPRFGAALMARDREEVTAAAATLEAGRLFDGRWSLRRDDALHTALELRDALGDRLAPAARARMEDVLAHVRDLPAGTGESRADAMTRLLVERAERIGTDLAGARRRLTAPEQAGLADGEEIRRWSGEGGVTASGTLPVALLAVRVPTPRQLPEQARRRTGALRDESLIAVLATVLRDVDRLTRLGDDDFLLILPALGLDDVGTLAHRLLDDLAAAQSPFLTGDAHLVVTVTRQRPFPLTRVVDALSWAEREGIPVAQIADR